MSAQSYPITQSRRRFGLRERLLLGLLLAALGTVLVAIVGWVSFQRVVDSQAAIVRDTLPAADALHDAVRGNARLAALAPRLARADSETELAQLAATLDRELPQMLDRLATLQSPHVEPELRQRLQSTAASLSRQLDAMTAAVAERLELRALRSSAVRELREDIDALETLAKTQADNATAFLVATLTSLLQGEATADPDLGHTRDTVLDLDVDTLERMHELNLTVHALGAGIDRLEEIDSQSSLASARRHFEDQLALLGRRLRDIPDPGSQVRAEASHASLQAALASHGAFSLREREIALAAQNAVLQLRVGELTTELDALAGELIHRGGRMLAEASLAAERSANPGFIAFGILSAALLIFTTVVSVHIIRRQTLGRLLALERATLALAAGQRDVVIDTSGEDELASLSRALERFREDAIERDRLSATLRDERQNLEIQVATRTAELRDTNAALAHEMAEHDAARARAEQADSAKTAFLGTLSHELRTPISGMLGLLELLEPTLTSQTQRHQLAQARSAATLLLELIEDMLDFARIEAGKVHVDKTPFNLRHAVNDVFAVQGARAASRGLALVADIDRSIPENLVGDRPKLTQILLNLTGNAIKFSDSGVVQLRITPLERPAHLRFSIMDHGIGIEAERQQEIFEPFVQIRDQGRHHAGTGLGLAVCKRLIEALGGRISLVSAPGAGTTVSFELEFGVAAAPPKSAAVADDPKAALSPGHKVLVVEDDEVNALVLERFVGMLGQVPLCASSIGAALRIAHQTPVAVAIVDMNLPDGDGVGLLSKLRKIPAYRSTPVVLISAHVRREEAERLRQAGFDSVMQKPVTQSQLRGVLGRLLSNPETITPGGHTVTDATPASEERVDKAFLNAEQDSLGMATVEQIATVFERQGESLIASLGDAASRGDADDARKLAHKLRGAAANVGLQQLSRHAAEVEETLSNTLDGKALQREVDSLVADYHQSVVELRDALRALRERSG